MNQYAIVSLLENIGLNHHESQVYLCLLQSGEQSASTIAKQSSTPRSTIRSILDKLCEKNIVSKVYRRNTQYYSCKDPQSLKTFIEQKISTSKQHLELLDQLLPEINKLRHQEQFAPRVQYFEGEAEVVEAFNHSLYQNVDELLLMTAYRFMQSSLLQKNDLEFYIPLRVKKKIPLRVLSTKSSAYGEQGGYNFYASNTAELRDHRFLPEQYSLPGNIHIYGPFVAYYSANDGEFMATVIESHVMAETMKMLFEFLWEKSITPR